MHTYTFDRRTGFSPAPEGQEAPVFTLTTDRKLDGTRMGGIGTAQRLAETTLDLGDGDERFTFDLADGDHVDLDGDCRDSALAFRGKGTVSAGPGYRTVLNPLDIHDDVVVDHLDNPNVRLYMHDRTRAAVENAQSLFAYDAATLTLDTPRPARNENSVISVDLHDKAHANIIGNLEGRPATSVSLHDLATTTADGNGPVILQDRSKADLYGQGHVILHGNSRARIHGEVRADVHDRAHVDVLDDCTVCAHDQATVSEGDTAMPGHHAPDRRRMTFLDQAHDPNHVLDAPTPNPATIIDRLRTMVGSLHGSRAAQQQEGMTR